MEKKREDIENIEDEDGLEWFRSQNHNFNIFLDPTIPENHRHVSSVSLFSPKNHLHRSYLSKNHRFHSPENRYPRINPYQYWPITLPSTTVYGNIWNILNAEFSHLNLSNPSRPSPFPPPSSSSSRNNSSPIDPYYSYSKYDENLQRMRVQSIVRGQMGLNQFNNGRPITTNNPTRSNQNGYDFDTPYYDRASNNSNRNGFRLRSNGFGGNDLHNLAPTLMELRGLVFLAKDKRGCLYLQKKIVEVNLEEIEMLLFELKDHVRELMVHQFGNSLIQKFFGVCNSDQITQILLLVISDVRYLMILCCDTHGYVFASFPTSIYFL
ncbi:putative pumilio homolog 13 [Camellia sinensis]|uniref:putative pumilio homolog 13 n=1 Tax=Camellia sinensis TaxID=4442 RepID=UPI0010368440|nr:putative pumilio homolog 13 [Camellia sinensis]